MLNIAVQNDYLGQYFDRIPTKLFSLISDVLAHPEPLSVNSLGPLVNHVFQTDIANKGMYRAVRGCFHDDGVDSLALSFANVLIRCKTPVARIVQILNDRKEPLVMPDKYESLQVKQTKLLLQHYNLNRVVKLLFQCDLTPLKDTLGMMERIFNEHPELKFLPEKPSSITKIHDACVRMLPKVGQPNFSLEQREDVLILDKKPILDDMVVRVPKTHYDLVDLGEDLGFCIGDGSYSKDVLNKRCSIVSVFDKKGPRYGVEFTRYRILQAHGFGNMAKFAPTKEVLKALQELLTEAPKMPKDFLPITDSGWVKGYRFNDLKNELYLLLNDYVYVYFDVQRETYEELLESDVKGRYVNKHIKGQHGYERVGHIEHMGA